MFGVAPNKRRSQIFAEGLQWVGYRPRWSGQTGTPFIRKEIVMEATTVVRAACVPWNKGKLTGQKPPLKLKEIWAIRIRLQLAARTRDLAMFNLAIDSKLRACDLTRLRVRDICLGQRVAARETVMQQKTQRPVQFEITELTLDSAEAWIKAARLSLADFLFPSRIHGSPHLSTRQYARLGHRWRGTTDLGDSAYGAP